MEQTEKTLEQLSAEIVDQAITCVRQTDKWRKPYAAIISPEGERAFLRSVGRFRTPLEAEDRAERADLTSRINSLEAGWRVETRDARDCSHKNERRDSWTRTESGWQHEVIKGRNKYGY
jgi:hypothetical protein